MKLSFVLPAYNESEKIKEFFDELHGIVKTECDTLEYVFVNDGSSDNTLELLLEIKKEKTEEASFKIINFSRNFGHQSAVTAGLSQCSGDVVILMDTDKQDDPTAIPKFLAAHREGHEVVYAVRSSREESPPLKFLFTAYYRIFSRISRLEIPQDAGNFGLMDKRVLDEINAMEEHNRYFPGLRAWVGFRQTGIDVPRRARADGKPKVGLMGLFRLALDGIVSFSNFPLRIAFLFALVLGLIGLTGIIVIVCIKLFTPHSVKMWASIMTTVIFIGSLQFLLIGLLGEYVGRIYAEVKKRPHYVIREIL
jgi:glycosyltransferase involved in cell wall biosynthesis